MFACMKRLPHEGCVTCSSPQTPCSVLRTTDCSCPLLPLRSIQSTLWVQRAATLGSVPSSKHKQLHNAQGNAAVTKEPNSSCCIPTALFLIPEAVALFRREVQSSSCSRTVQTCLNAWRGVLLSSLFQLFFCSHLFLQLTASRDWNYILVAQVKEHFTAEVRGLHTFIIVINVIIIWGF